MATMSSGGISSACVSQRANAALVFGMASLNTGLSTPR
jgi:hypothetical protein